VQRWDSNSMMIENGVYLGQLAALTFRGPFVMSGVRALSPSAVCCIWLLVASSVSLSWLEIMRATSFIIAPDKLCTGAGCGGSVS